jgi:hypothetical protein
MAWGSTGLVLKGDQGDQGIQGEPGEQGEQGVPGAAGAGINIAGSVATYDDLPTDLDAGDAGDAYLAEDDGDLYIWSGTAFPAEGSGVEFKGDKGDTGTAGADGKTVRNGSGAPSSGLGVDGDFYVRTDNDSIYGPKTAGAWGTARSLVGPQGTAGTDGDDGATGQRGTKWFSGHGAPGTIPGAIAGDLYLDLDDGAVHEFS